MAEEENEQTRPWQF